MKRKSVLKLYICTMKWTFFFLLLMITTAFVKSDSVLLDEVIKAHQSLNTLKADFTQEKEDEFLLEKSVTQGYLKYDKAAKRLLWQMNGPQPRTLYIDDEVLKIKEEGKIKTYAMHKHKMLSFLKKIMMGTLDGSLLQDEKDFQVTVKRSGTDYLILMQAKSAMMKKMMPKMEMIYQPSTKLVKEITMFEDEVNKSVIKFENAQRNVKIGAADFSL